MRNFAWICLLLIGITGTQSCDKCNKQQQPNIVPTKPAVVVNAPPFNVDSAYMYIQKQVDFGPRNMNSKGHNECAAWLESALRGYADTVYVQKFETTGFDGKLLKGTNLIGAVNPQATTRILLCSHWDSRPWADQDTKDREKPILAACDGASGVGVLLEIARAVQAQKLNNIGIDIFLIDAEDYGYSSVAAELVEKVVTTDDTYCLGSQYWGKHLHVPGYRADFGLLLDMVGARNAVFTREGHSAFNASWVHEKVWGNAANLGFGSFFSNQTTPAITDDHFYITNLTKIPTVDIIQYDASTPSGFGSYWHTHNDNMEVIDKATLNAVGKTLLYTIYQYEAEQAAP